MPIEFKDDDGNLQRGGSVSITGWSAVGCLLFITLAMIGLVTVITLITGLPA